MAGRARRRPCSRSASPRAATTTAAAAAAAGASLSGTVAIDGSCTVFPFAQAAAELFQEENPDVKVTVGESGTGGGFEKFCAGETDISDASRPIEDDEEVPVCEKNGVKYGEVQVANDGIAVVTNPELKIDCLTTDQLKELWNQGSKVTNYSQLGDSRTARRSRTPSSRSTGRAPTRARSTSSPRRSTVRRASRARTTSRPRTTTCSSRASRATRAASATSASPTTRTTRTS